MALFLVYGSGSSSTSRLNILALIAFILVCFCSYCSSTSLVPPIIDVDSLADDIDMFDIDDDTAYYTPLKLSSHHHRNVPEEAILPSKNHFLNLLLKSAVIQPDHRHKLYNDKRYVSQAFHAMRG
jgi:hypothetical protein